MLVWVALLLALVGCQVEPQQFQTAAVEVELTADGETRAVSSAASTVRELLDEQSISLAATDEVTPPLFTPLSSGLTVRVVRISESIETIDRAVPFERRIVRNEAMDEDDPPRILQAGRAGLEQLTVRIVYRDGIEAERRVTQVTTLEESQEEIVMVGLGLNSADLATFSGLIAYINGNTPTLLRSSNSLPEPLDIGGALDRRVFALSPSGSHLLFTRVATATNAFNELWVIETVPGAEPRPLDVRNVLWAGWNPARASAQQIAFSTGVATNLPPGWEANNDLWLGTLLADEAEPFEPGQIVDSYPATYGWWGGNYAWAPDGEAIGYSFADEIGIINLNGVDNLLAAGPEDEAFFFLGRRTLTTFQEYDTRADWVWVPTITWSPDSRYLAFTAHGGDSTLALEFETQIVDTATGRTGRLADEVGIWSHPHWANQPVEQGEIAFLRAQEPFASLQSGYTLWLMDSDGSNSRQVFPPAGENTAFPRQASFLAWQGDGSGVVFVFEDDLYLYNLTTNQISVLADEEAVASNPTWAPYGAGLAAPAVTLPATPLPIEERR